MTQWELARYIINAKKCVDSVWYIAENVAKIANINLREKVDSILQDFYIDVCAVLDNSFPRKKKELCSKDKIVERIYYERDKNYAHKDMDYKPIPLNSFYELKKRLEFYIIHIRDLCKQGLPKVLTLDFVPYDKELFRFINGLTAEKEEEIKSKKYPLYNAPLPQGIPTIKKNILYDVDDLRGLTEAQKQEYCVIIEDGLNSYEGIQLRQDACIKINIFTGNTSMWVSPSKKAFSIIQELKSKGFLDQYEIPIIEKWSNPTCFKIINDILDR